MPYVHVFRLVLIMYVSRWINCLNPFRRAVMTLPSCFIQGSPGISEITRGRFFFLSCPGHPPLLGQKRICQIYSEKNIYRFGICSKKNIYGFRIYYKNIVYLSMPCVVSLLSTPVKPYVHALCLQHSPGG